MSWATSGLPWSDMTPDLPSATCPQQTTREESPGWHSRRFQAPPGALPSLPLFVPDALNNRLWHIPFNRVDNELTVQLVRGREDVFFGYEFDIQDGGRRLPAYARRYSSASLRGVAALCVAASSSIPEWGAMLAQNRQRAKQPLEMPVLGIGGASSWSAAVAKAMQPLASDVHTAVIPGAGHWVAEQAPRALVASLREFLAPHRAAPSRSSA